MKFVISLLLLSTSYAQAHDRGGFHGGGFHQGFHQGGVFHNGGGFHRGFRNGIYGLPQPYPYYNYGDQNGFYDYGNGGTTHYEDESAKAPRNYTGRDVCINGVCCPSADFYAGICTPD